MNYNNITIGIVTFKSEKVIFECLKSIKKIKKIIIFDNSYDAELKKKIKKKYPNINFILSKKNLGYGGGNNKIFQLAKTSHVLILNPDTIMGGNCEKELLKNLQQLKSKFAIMSPNEKNKNFGLFKENNENKINLSKDIYDVDYVKGFAMLINLQKIKNVGMFDKNIFLYLEDIDLCKRLKLKKQKIYVCKKAEIYHLGAKSSNFGFESEKCRNWHWMWSKVYYNKKFSNNFVIYTKFIVKLILYSFRLIAYSLTFQMKKKIIIYMRMSGIYNSLMGRKSWYRPVFRK
jgi:N-acetylglucosaminyl-diphospho-decaprenol L-rhamnosyltransferase